MDRPAPRWLPGGHLQTIWPALWARRVTGAPIAYQRIPRHTARGLVQGNAFSVVFHPAQPTLAADMPFDTPLV